MRQFISGLLFALAGFAIVASAVLHGAVNVPHLRGDMIEIGVRPTLLRAIVVVLSFSVVAMFAFGGLVLNAAQRSLRGLSPDLAPLWLVATTYLVFGLVAFVSLGGSPHALGYSVMGMLVAAGAALCIPHAIRP